VYIYESPGGHMEKPEGCVCTVILPFYIKKYLKAKEEFWIFHHAKKKKLLIFKKKIL
jgi:hypothetical protein